MNRKKVITKDIEFEEKIGRCKAKCKCGHTLVMPVQQEKEICTWCGRVIKNNSKEYFIYKLKETMKK